MQITKKVLDTMERCYCTSSVTIDGETHIILASEAEGGSCYAYHGENFETREVVWDGPGGTMSLVEIPGTNGEFLAVQCFYPGFRSERAKIVWGRRDPGEGWIIRDVANLPYVHRFDILTQGDRHYFIGATLCTSKKDREDWSDPGKLYVAELPADLTRPLDMQVLREGLTKNHGYWRGSHQGRMAGYITSEEGVIAALPPKSPGSDWQVVPLMDHPVSDIAVVDIDGDGVEEYATLEPFHGNGFKIFKGSEGGFREIYTYPNEINFAHAIWGGKLRGRPALLGGIRRMDSELFLVQWNGQEFQTTVIERGGGPSNVAVLNGVERDVIICANHSKNEAALYVVTD